MKVFRLLHTYNKEKCHANIRENKIKQTIEIFYKYKGFLKQHYKDNF